MNKRRERAYSYEKRIDWLYSLEVQNLIPNHTHKHVLGCLTAKYVNAESGLCWPSQATLANDTGLGRTTIYRALKELTRQKVISLVANGKDTNTYRINIDKVGFGPGRKQHKSKDLNKYLGSL